VTLQNLLRIGRLNAHTPSAVEIQRLLAAAERNLADAKVAAVSEETRFDAAYKAIMQAALIAMMASGFRPATNEPGHHQTLIQSLPLSCGVDKDVWVVLDALRRKRNLSDYSGDPVDEGLRTECVEQAEALLKHLRKWLKQQYPELLK
jgi:HEPN domain-containing protein